MSSKVRDSLVDALYTRFERWQRDQDNRIVLDPAAENEIARLLELPGINDDLQARHAAGMVLWCRFAASGSADQGAYWNAIELLEPVALTQPEAVPEQVLEAVQYRTGSSAHADQGVAAYQQYEQTNDLAQLDQAIQLMASAAAQVPPTMPAAAKFLFNLGTFSWTRFGHTGSVDDLFAAADHFSKATEIDQGRLLGDGASNLYQYAAYLVTSYQSNPVPELLSCAIQLQRCAVQLTAAVNRASYASFLADLVQINYEHTGQAQLLDDSVAIAEWAVGLEPDNSSALLSLSIALNHRASTTGDSTVADQAIAHAERAVAAFRSQQSGAVAAPGTGRALQVLGMALRISYSLTDDQATIDRAVEVLREAVAATDREDPDHVRRLMALAEVLRVTVTDPVRAAEAVAIARRVVEATSPGDPEYGMRRSILVIALVALHKLTDDPATLAEALAEARSAQRVIDPASNAYLPVVRALAVALSRDTGGDEHLANVDEGLGLLRDCLAVLPPGHPESANIRKDLAELYAVDAHSRLLRYTQAPDDADLDRIIESAHQGVAADSTALTTLCSALRAKFEASGNRADLDRSIAAGLQAVDALADDRATLVRAQAAVGFALRLRYEHTEHLASLDDAISLLQSSADGSEVDARTEEGDKFLAAALNMLGNARWARHLRTTNASELESAIAVLRRAVALDPDPGFLSNLGMALRTQYERTKESALLDEVVAILQRAVREAPPSNNRRQLFESNLGSTLLERFLRDGELADLDAAIAANREAIAAPAAGPLFITAARSNLGNYWVHRFRRTQDPADFRAALTEYKAVVQSPVAPPILRCKVGLDWGVLAAGQQEWAEALEGYSIAVAQLPSIAPRFLDRSDQEHGLRQLVGLGPEAAASAIHASAVPASVGGSLELWVRAVELLDQGRGILLTHQLESRGDVSRLRAVAPDLAARFEELRDRRNQESA